MDGDERLLADRTPGVEEHESTASVLSYTVGVGLAIVATIASFVVAQTNLLWGPGMPVGLIVLALAQIGVHLVFFLHLGSGPDDTNNILALAFGVLVVFLIIAGSIWIIANLNANMMPMSMHLIGIAIPNPAGEERRPKGRLVDRLAM
jgi:cytochrome o ubiquinol oxidase operon protein cyoD